MSDQPTDELRHEHEIVLVVVAAMEREAAAIRAGEPVDADAVASMVDITRNFTDGCHHNKEEKVLFPLMEEKSPGAGGPVSVMLAEHETGRGFISAVDGNLPRTAAAGAAGASAGDTAAAAARAAVAESLALYAELLRMHIHKENEVLFPLAERTLDDEAKQTLAAEFERVEAEETGAGVHERYHELAHELGAHRL
jgi:hemerythrin-like domain-containing protein